MLSHCFGGTLVKSQSAIDNGELKMTAKAPSSEQMPLEWIDVQNLISRKIVSGRAGVLPGASTNIRCPAVWMENAWRMLLRL